MSCKHIQIGTMDVWMCNPWESYMQQMVAESLEAERLYRLEQDKEIAQQLDWEKPSMLHPKRFAAEMFFEWDAYGVILEI